MKRPAIVHLIRPITSRWEEGVYPACGELRARAATTEPALVTCGACQRTIAYRQAIRE